MFESKTKRRIQTQLEKKMRQSGQYMDKGAHFQFFFENPQHVMREFK